MKLLWAPHFVFRLLTINKQTNKQLNERTNENMKQKSAQINDRDEQTNIQEKANNRNKIESG